ncbi:hypothetical protein QQZ08_007412 [Neonectria magnoliae]|uniref:FAD-binding domain-containing protein n=1 Tax=Neonectria magnoliae TaxID=2732573 RepID=A0ABR1HY47_9HYPO
MHQHLKSPVLLDVIIVGAGLSGLAAAISCALSGHNVSVFESTRELSEAGAGLQVTPNSSRLLQQWGLLKKIWETAAEPTFLAVHRYSGQTLALEENFDKKMREKYGAPFIDIHRVDLQLGMFDRAKELGVKFHFGQKVQSIDFDIPQITTKSGITSKANLIIAADGIWSLSRNCFLGRRDDPKSTGDLAYRIVLGLDQIQEPELQEWIKNPSVRFWIGPGAHAVGYSLHGGQMYNIVLLVPDDLPEGASRQSGSVEEIREFFKDWDPILTKFLNQVVLEYRSTR